jgi:CBS domain-containing protein
MSSITDILDTKGGMVLAVDRDATVFDAISIMAETNIGAVLIRENDDICGIFTERDYLQKIALESRSSHETPVQSVMSTPVITAGPTDSIETCLQTMTRCRCRHLPVVNEGNLLGIVSIGDLVKHMLAEKEQEVEQLSQYITGNY